MSLISKAEIAAMLAAGIEAARARVSAGNVSLGSVVNAASNAVQAALPEPLEAINTLPPDALGFKDRLEHMQRRQALLRELHAACNLLHDKLHVELARHPPGDWQEAMEHFAEGLSALIDHHWIED